MYNEPFCSACGTDVEGFVQPKTTNNVYSADQKSRIAAGLLGIFLGCYGVHNFYLGYL